MPQETPAPEPRRGIPRWLKVTVIMTLVLANVVLIGLLWAVQTGRDVLAAASTDDAVSGVLDAAQGEGLTFLIVGSDTREGLDDLTNFGNVGGERGDVIMLARSDPGSEVVHLLSIPRDLYVDIPGRGKDKINAAYAYGGPSLMVETVQQNLDIEVNHYVQIDFVGFRDLVDELGGIEMTFPNPARDIKSGLDVGAGTQTLDGDEALAYARSRQYQELRNGTWVSVEANDIGRTGRQREVVAAIMRELRSPSSIAEAGSIAGAMARHMTIDSRLAESSVAGLMWDHRGLLAGDVDGITLPTTTQTIGGASVQVMKQPEASQVLADFRSNGMLSQPTLRLQVLNGNGIAGAAAGMSDTLESEGFEIAAIGDASAGYETTTVIVPLADGTGRRIVDALGFGVVEVGSVDNRFDAVVIVGADAA